MVFCKISDFSVWRIVHSNESQSLDIPREPYLKEKRWCVSNDPPLNCLSSGFSPQPVNSPRFRVRMLAPATQKQDP